MGYVVFQVRDKTVFVEDLFAIDPDDALKRVLAHFLIDLKPSDVSTINISFFGAQRILNLLAEFGFTVRQEERTFLVLIRKDSKNLATVTDQQNWYFLHADNDVDA
jgi:hypothetical protein